MKKVVAFLTCFALMFCMIGTSGVQAKSTKTMHVITKVSQKGAVNTFSYNKRGLISKRTVYADGKKYGSSVFKYDRKKKGKLKEVKNIPVNDMYGNEVLKYYYKSNGILKKVNSSVAGDYIVKKTSKGKATLIKCNEKNNVVEYKIAYNKKGHIKKISGEINNMPILYTFKYDKKGNLSKSSIFTYKNTYKNERLVKQTIIYSSDDAYTLKYKYKNVEVPKKYVKKVRKQQWNIINGDADPGLYLPMVQ